MAKLNLKNVRVGWVNVYEKAKDSVDQSGNPVKGKYQFTVYLDKNDPQLTKLEAAAMEALTEPKRGIGSVAAAEKWLDRNYGFGNHADKCAVRDLAERDKPIEGMEEGLYFKATSHKFLTNVQTSLGEKQASLTQRAVKGLTVEGDEVEGKEVYGGCFANVSVDVYWYGEYKCLLISALGIRFRADGDAFGGAGEVATDDDLSDDDDDKQSKPKRRPSRDEDDEEEERPRKKRRNYEDDEE